MRAISENRFHEHFRPKLDKNGDFLEYADVVNEDIHHVWTIVEDDYGQNWYAVPGFHIVNKLGYVTTEVPWTDPGREALYFGR